MSGLSFISLTKYSKQRLSFCDLAGLERSKQTEATGKTAKEASNINQSLLSLSRCINTMINNQKAGANKEQIPYRISKLTRLFQAYFEGRGMVKMIVNFNPSLSCFDESVGVLKFSSIANQIQLSLAKEEDKKVQYQISTKKAAKETNQSHMTVGWQSGGESEDGDGDEDDEEETGSEESGEEGGDDETMELEGSEEESGGEESGEEVSGSDGDEEEGESDDSEGKSFVWIWVLSWRLVMGAKLSFISIQISIRFDDNIIQ